MFIFCAYYCKITDNSDCHVIKFEWTNINFQNLKVEEKLKLNLKDLLLSDNDVCRDVSRRCRDVRQRPKQHKRSWRCQHRSAWRRWNIWPPRPFWLRKNDFFVDLTQVGQSRDKNYTTLPAVTTQWGIKLLIIDFDAWFKSLNKFAPTTKKATKIMDQNL